MPLRHLNALGSRCRLRHRRSGPAAGTLNCASLMPVSRDRLAAYHADARVLPRLAPPWQRTRLVAAPDDPWSPGAQVHLRLGGRHLGIDWIARGERLPDGSGVVDTQQRGPFKAWRHAHRFHARDGNTSLLSDEVHYRCYGGIAVAALRPLLDRQFSALFRYRHRVTRHDLMRHHQAGLSPQRIAITGASGLIGRQLRAMLIAGGHSVIELSRRAAGPDRLHWDPSADALPVETLRALEGIDACIHLAGESIAGGRWSTAKKQRIRDSRTQGTAVLARGLAQLARPPRVLLCASGINAYGDTGERLVDEDTPLADDFLAHVCRDWEAAADPARVIGMRVVHLRTGMVLSAEGGALAQMLPAFRCGFGGAIGDGQQWVSWIALDDLLGCYLHALADGSMTGVVNATSPQPLRQRDFARRLARCLQRPAIVPLPAAVVRLLFGEMGDTLLLSSIRACPERLAARDFAFAYPGIDAALAHTLGRL